jgi:hypothetical protein
MAKSSAPGARDEASAIPPAEDGERISITGTHGTVAQFDMSYSPPDGSRSKFGPPWRARIPSAAYLAGAIVLAAVVGYAYTTAPSSSLLFFWVVEQDRGRPLSAGVLTTVIAVSALATVIRTHMRGVLVGDDGLEARFLLPFGIPRARRWAWPQVHRIVVDGGHVGLELWDGGFERLPEVEDVTGLVDALLRCARMRKITVTVLRPTPA